MYGSAVCVSAMVNNFSCSDMASEDEQFLITADKQT